jgi:hypothetical protein
MKRRLLLTGTAALGVTGLTGCASPTIADYASEKPVLDLRKYFNGTVDAWGVFTNRSGKVVKRFTVVMNCRWSGEPGREVGVLDEDFSYSDGTTQKRIWTLRRTPSEGAQGRYSGTAGDVVGEARGEERGNAFYWSYDLDLPVDGRNIVVHFEDWMYQMDDRVMLNRATMSKWGVTLGEVTLSFTKR